MYCVHCGNELKTFPNSHDCMEAYSETLYTHAQVTEGYSKGVSEMEEERLKVERTIMEIERLGSQILIEKGEQDRLDKDI